MKILLVNDYGAPEGGAEIAMLLLRAGLRARGHEAMIFTSSARSKGMSSEVDAECYGTTSSLRTLLQCGNLSARSQLARVVANFQPDLVHVGTFLTQLSPLILPLLRGRPSLYHAHWLRAICPTGFKMLPDGTACRHPSGFACFRSRCLPLRDWVPLMGQMQLWERWRGVFDRVVANSEATRSALEAEGFANVTVIPCGVPRGPVPQPMAKVPTALFSGRLTCQKGVHLLLDAWKSVIADLPEARLLIAGDGPQREQLERQVQSGVTFLGRLEIGELDRLAGTAWIQVVPSIGFEPFGLVTAEAMMRGRGVVATRVGGTPELVEPGLTGTLVDAGDRDALAAALTAVLRNRSWCEQLGERARRVAEERHSADLYVERFIELYATLVADNRTPRLEPTDAVAT